MAGTGILAPQLANQFRVMFGNAPEDIAQQMALQIVRISLDYVNKEVAFIIEQPLAGGALHQFLEQWLHGHPSLSVIALDGGGNEQYIIRLTELKPTKHAFDLDYASPSTAAFHNLKFKYGQLTMGEPKRVDAS